MTQHSLMIRWLREEGSVSSCCQSPYGTNVTSGFLGKKDSWRGAGDRLRLTWQGRESSWFKECSVLYWFHFRFVLILLLFQEGTDTDSYWFWLLDTWIHSIEYLPKFNKICSNFWLVLFVLHTFTLGARLYQSIADLWDMSKANLWSCFWDCRSNVSGVIIEIKNKLQMLRFKTLLN